MSSNQQRMRCRWAVLACMIMLAGCAAPPAKKPLARQDDPTPEVALVYYQGLSRLTVAELGRERMVLTAVPQTPFTQVRMAMLLGHSRVQQDLGKALALLDNVQKSTDPAAIPFHALARLIADNYQERVKMETQLDKQGQQLKDSQRKAAELQEKLDSLADIERTLTPRPPAARPGATKR